MKQNKLLNLLNHEFPMHPAYLAFRATEDNGARFTNPMEWRDNISDFTIYQKGDGFRMVIDNRRSEDFSDRETMLNHVEKLSRLPRRKTPQQKLMARIANHEAEIAKLQAQLADLKRELAFYN